MVGYDGSIWHTMHADIIRHSMGVHDVGEWQWVDLGSGTPVDETAVQDGPCEAERVRGDADDRKYGQQHGQGGRDRHHASSSCIASRSE